MAPQGPQRSHSGAWKPRPSGRGGRPPEGKQRYRCRACLEGRGRTFLLDYTYAGQAPEVKQQIVDMAMNASGIRDTARVLHVSPTTLLNELKKRNRTCKR